MTKVTPDRPVNPTNTSGIQTEYWAPYLQSLSARAEQFRNSLDAEQASYFLAWLELIRRSILQGVYSEEGPAALSNMKGQLRVVEFLEDAIRDHFQWSKDQGDKFRRPAR